VAIHRETAAANADRDLIGAMRDEMRSAADPVRGAAQQAYMKSTKPYFGLAAPTLKAVLRPLLRAYAPASRATHEATVLALWDEATHREEWYAAIALARHRVAQPWRDPDSLDLWRHLVVTGAWWDVVDETAAHLVGDVLRHHRPDATPVVHAWATDEDLWLRRTSVIAQLAHKGETDLDLLTHAVEANLEDRSFWLRKAIGWALREHARTDPEWILERVDGWGDRMSGLSRREALKHLG
jgi:3-methyladenine DNA glycosylase AlkD